MKIEMDSVQIQLLSVVKVQEADNLKKIEALVIHKWKFVIMFIELYVALRWYDNQVSFHFIVHQGVL